MSSPTRLSALACLLLVAGAEACNKKASSPPPASDAGPACTRDADCDGGGVCDTALGTCGACSSSGQCQPHQSCASPGPGQPLTCLFNAGYGDQCTLNTDCPTSQVCHQGLCLPSSQVTLCPTGQCPPGQRCNRTNVVCEADAGCFANADCDPSSACNTTTHQCVPTCTAANADQVCASGQKCVDGVCAQCGQDSDCPDGLVCDTAAGVCGNGATCFSDGDCQVPLVCNPVTRQCTQPPPPCVSNEQCQDGFECDLASGDCIPQECQPDRYEPNDTLAQAAPVGSGTDLNVSGLTVCNGVPGFFSFPLQQGDLVQVVVDADALTASSFTAVLYDPQGSVIATGNLAVNGVAASDGSYAVEVRSTNLDEGFGLRIQVDETTDDCQPDAYQPDGLPSQAVRVAPPGLDALSLCPGDREWYFVDVPLGDGLHVELDSAASQGALDLYALAADAGAVIGSNSSGADVESIDLPSTLVEGSQVFLTVVGDDARTANQYSLGVAFEPPSDAGQESP